MVFSAVVAIVTSAVSAPNMCRAAGAKVRTSPTAPKSTAMRAQSKRSIPVGSWRHRLRQLHGEVAVLCGRRGVFGVGEDGGILRIAKTKAAWCALDNHGDAVWIGRARPREVWVLDLLRNGPPKRVLRGALQRTGVVYDKGPRFQGVWHNETHHMQLRVDQGRAAVYGGRMDYTLPKGAIKQARRRAKISNRKMLRRLARRAQAARSATTKPDKDRRCPPNQRVPGLPATLPRCEEPQLCARFAERIGKTPYCPVVVQWECGDSCTIAYGLWHGSKRRFVTLGGLFASVDTKSGRIAQRGKFAGPGEALFSPTGARLIARGMLFGADGKVRHKGFGGSRGGWLERLAIHPGR